MLNGELLGVMGREGTHANTNTQPPTNTHHFSTAHGNNGGGSHRHPPSGMCGRESCQALWGGKGTRANTTTTPSPTPIHHTQPSKPLWGRLNSTPTKWGVWKGELSGVAEGRAPAPTRPLHLHQHQSTTHNLQNNHGGSSIRHPPSGQFGRESCQALWGGKGTRANTTTTPSPTPFHHTQPSKQLWGRLNSTPTKWGVWKGELSGVAEGRAPAPTRPLIMTLR